jgi:protein-tyrosine phosphatase
LKDRGDENIYQYFEETYKFICAAKTEGKAIFIHCQQAISRSPTVLAAYFIKTFSIDVLQIIEMIKKYRNCIAPNLGFMGQLLTYQQEHTAILKKQWQNVMK